MAQRVSISRACARIAWLGLGVFLGLPSAADARVTRINITTVESPTFDGASFGAVGQYERIEGTITGEVDPNVSRGQTASIGSLAWPPMGLFAGTSWRWRKARQNGSSWRRAAASCAAIRVRNYASA